MDDQADLSHLADIVTPPPVPWWPPAPGWWILGAALLIVAAVLLHQAVRQYRRNAYRRAALAELAALGPIADHIMLIAISALLKRTALVAYPRNEVAGLTGAGWLRFLDQAASTTAFTTGPAAVLGQAAQGQPITDGEAIRRAAQNWIAHHRVSPVTES